jgi:hypothetical protein
MWNDELTEKKPYTPRFLGVRFVPDSSLNAILDSSYAPNSARIASAIASA